jgi:hypothetical protein
VRVVAAFHDRLLALLGKPQSPQEADRVVQPLTGQVLRKRLVRIVRSESCTENDVYKTSIYMQSIGVTCALGVIRDCLKWVAPAPLTAASSA